MRASAARRPARRGRAPRVRERRLPARRARSGRCPRVRLPRSARRRSSAPGARRSRAAGVRRRGRRSQRRRLRPERPHRAGRCSPTAARSSASGRPAGSAGLPRPLPGPRADDRARGGHRRRRRAARAGPLPTFLQDGLLYAYLSTATDNRVVRFPLGGTPNPVLTGIPRGEIDNGGGLLFDADGTLSSAPGTPGTRRSPATRTRWPARCSRSTPSAAPWAPRRSTAGATGT